jgi:hypothetical protein
MFLVVSVINSILLKSICPKLLSKFLNSLFLLNY